jgi:Holliday junction resolvasome RuvABC endonuclease subunit
MKIYCGIDPGFSGAWGMIDEHGKYVSCGDMINDGKFILSHHVWAEMSQARDKQDIEVVVEAVHAMPKQGVSSMFKFGMAYGAAISLAQRFNVQVNGVAPRVWKKALKLDSDKDLSLSMARDLWPNAPLARKKDNGRAEALLMAHWLRGDLA